MIEWTKILATGLADPTNGVNALLPGVPRYAGHAQPPDVTIYNEYDHGFLARGVISEDSPMAASALLVYHHEASEVAAIAQTEETDATPTLIVSVPLRLSDSALAMQRAGYTLRAAYRSLVRLNDTMPYGEVHGISLIEPKKILWLAPFAPQGATVLQLGLAYTATFRDDLPRG